MKSDFCKDQSWVCSSDVPLSTHWFCNLRVQQSEGVGSAYTTCWIQNSLIFRHEQRLRKSYWTMKATFFLERNLREILEKETWKRKQTHKTHNCSVNLDLYKGGKVNSARAWQRSCNYRYVKFSYLKIFFDLTQFQSLGMRTVLWKEHHFIPLLPAFRSDVLKLRKCTKVALFSHSSTDETSAEPSKYWTLYPESPKVTVFLVDPPFSGFSYYAEAQPCKITRHHLKTVLKKLYCTCKGKVLWFALNFKYQNTLETWI